MSEQDTPVSTAEGSAPQAPAIAPAAATTGVVDPQPTPAAGTSPAAVAEPPKRFEITTLVKDDGERVTEETDSPIVAHARLQEGFEVLDRVSGKDYAIACGMKPALPATPKPAPPAAPTAAD